MLGAGQSYLCENARAMMRPLVTSLCLPLHRAASAVIGGHIIVVIGGRVVDVVVTVFAGGDGVDAGLGPLHNCRFKKNLQP